MALITAEKRKYISHSLVYSIWQDEALLPSPAASLVRYFSNKRSVGFKGGSFVNC